MGILDPKIYEYTIPVGLGRSVSLTGLFPLTHTEWLQLMRVLEAMKPGLVKDEVKAAEPATEPWSDPEPNEKP